MSLRPNICNALSGYAVKQDDLLPQNGDDALIDDEPCSSSIDLDSPPFA